MWGCSPTAPNEGPSQGVRRLSTMVGITKHRPINSCHMTNMSQLEYILFPIIELFLFWAYKYFEIFVWGNTNISKSLYGGGIQIFRNICMGGNTNISKFLYGGIQIF